jgi:hypothetical protein
MEIGPLSNRPPGPRPGGEGNHRPEPSLTTPTRARTTTDRVEITCEARARLANRADQELAKEKVEPQPVDAGDQSREGRLDQIKERIASGYYTDPQVRAKIVDRLIDDLDS